MLGLHHCGDVLEGGMHAHFRSFSVLRENDSDLVSWPVERENIVCGLEMQSAESLGRIWAVWWATHDHVDNELGGHFLHLAPDILHSKQLRVERLP